MSGGPRRRPLSVLLADIYADAVAACDGAHLVEKALAPKTLTSEGLVAALSNAPAGTSSRQSLHVFALGKAAVPMTEGLLAALARSSRPAPVSGLVITTAPLAGGAQLPPAFRLAIGEHPRPGAASLAAGEAARDFVTALPRDATTVVLLSGGGSALACLPAGALSLNDKVMAIAALAARGAAIHEINTLRKHLSAIKGGRLARHIQGHVVVLALSDVINDDPSVIASGPFHPDPTTFADALTIVANRNVVVPTAVHDHLAAGAAGHHPETPKPGELPPIRHHVIGRPRDVVTAAHASITGRGLRAVTGVLDSSASVEALAAAYAARASIAPDKAPDGDGGASDIDVIVGNGEPRVMLTSDRPSGRGGRATHLALLMAKALRGHADRAFLAAGTDDRDGSSDGTGAVVDGQTWDDALAHGLDPQASLDGYDSATLLAQLGALVVGPARSNLLDLHLLACGNAPPAP